MTTKKSVIFSVRYQMRTIWWFGKSIRLSILDMYNGHVPFLLSGGINSYSANALKEFKHPRLAGYDLNSRFELKPGEKDPERIRTFLNELKS